MEDYLIHAGIKGMKWGVRRYQNKDGTLTNAGKKRYARDAREKGFKEYDDKSGTYFKKTKKGQDELDVDASRYVKEDLQRTKRLVDETRGMSNELQRVNEKAIKNTPKNPRMDLSNMTDKELRDQINRELLERQYNDVFNPPQVSKGREYAGQILETTGSALAVTASALGIALAIKELRG